MIISLNWLNQYTKTNLPADELATLIGSRLVEVESVTSLESRYKGILVVEVSDVIKHPDADSLHIVHIDDGKKCKDVDRLDNGLIQVVCGAPNVKKNQKVVWLPPGATVPSTIDKQPVTLEARALRGVVSNGMIASAKELAVGEDHEGILVVDSNIASGTPFAEVYSLDDYIFDIENKSLTHRPDTFGVVGFAREVAAISGKTFKTPKWLIDTEPTFPSVAKKSSKIRINASIEDSEISSRYQIVALDSVDPKKHSSTEMQSYLSRVGVRPINAIVDITNYLMLVSGQPLHAFDLDKVIKLHPNQEVDISVREARANETLKLLDGRTLKLSEKDIVICSADTPIALGGAMGGADTEIDETTTRILLESANFNLFRLRTTQMKHGVYSDAITRFTKGQSPDQTAPVMAQALTMLMNDGANIISNVIDVYPTKAPKVSIDVDLQSVCDTLGLSLTSQECTELLSRTEMVVKNNNKNILSVSPPYWRQDIKIAEDIIEEIGRINGFDTISPRFPQKDMSAVMISEFDQFRSDIRTHLRAAGSNELLTYTFVHGNIFKKAEQDISSAYKLSNALSPDLQFYRLSILPSLLEKANLNFRQGFKQFSIYEINKVHNKHIRDNTEEDLPKEVMRLGLIYCNDDQEQDRHGAPYYYAKEYLEYMARRFHVECTIVPYESNDNSDDIKQMYAPFEPKRSAQILINGNVCGIVGEFKSSVQKSFKLPNYIAGFELDLEVFHAAARSHKISYTPLSKYPSTEQDICLQVPEATSYAAIETIAKDILQKEKLQWELRPVDIYQPDSSNRKNVTLRIKLTDINETITSDRASVVVAYIGQRAVEQLDAKVI